LLPPNYRNRATDASDDKLILNAIEHQHFDLVDEFIGNTDLMLAIQKNNRDSFCVIFCNTIKSGRIELLDSLLTVFHQTLPDVLSRLGDGTLPINGLRLAISSKQTAMLAKVLAADPDALAKMGVLSVLAYTISFGSPELLDFVLTLPGADEATSLLNIFQIQRAHPRMIDSLLNFPDLFNLLARNPIDFQQYIDPFIAVKLPTILSQSIEAITPKKAQICFAMICYLTRQNNTESNEKSHLLMIIPQVKALLHQSNNELLREAMRADNQLMMEHLLTIPEVYALAAANDFYQVEGRTLLAIANDPESALRPLTAEQIRMYEKLVLRYHPVMMQQGGIEHAFQGMLSEFKDHYQGTPILFELDTGEVVPLPLEKIDFDCMSLAMEQKRHATEAYLRHPLHSTIRFLSSFNQWLSPEARFVNQTLKMAQIEKHKQMIVLTWYASRDMDPEMSPPDPNINVNDRIQHYFNSLALIGRAHNWDKSPQMDDLEMDNPSCSSGMETRLMECVLWHPLINAFSHSTPLTTRNLNADINAFVHGYFKDTLTAKNIASMGHAFRIFATDPEYVTEPCQLLLTASSMNESVMPSYVEIASEVTGNHALLMRNNQLWLVNKAYGIIKACGNTDQQEDYQACLIAFKGYLRTNVIKSMHGQAVDSVRFASEREKERIAKFGEITFQAVFNQSIHDAKELLTSLNVPLNKLFAFTTAMQQKYAQDWNPFYTDMIKRRFNENQGAHFITFGTQLNAIFINKQEIYLRDLEQAQPLTDSNEGIPFRAAFAGAFFRQREVNPAMEKTNHNSHKI